MEKLQLQNNRGLTLTEYVYHAGQLGIPEEIAREQHHNILEEHFYRNDEYMVLVRDVPPSLNPKKIPGIKWISIQREDRTPVKSQKDVQEIKNQILGEEGEAVQIFFSESRGLEKHLYHLFGGIGWKAPFGFV